METAELVKEKTTELPQEDAAVLQRYAMWNPKVMETGILCEPCSHCSPVDKEPPTKENVKKARIRSLHGECHCHPCGSCGRDIVPNTKFGQK
jgi:hypothetical protein